LEFDALLGLLMIVILINSCPESEFDALLGLLIVGWFRLDELHGTFLP
jgi:hypothetical protein